MIQGGLNKIELNDLQGEQIGEISEKDLKAPILKMRLEAEIEDGFAALFI